MLFISKKHSLFVTILLITINNICIAQDASEGKLSKKIIETIKAAEDNLLSNNPKKAEELYLKVLKTKPNYAIAKRGLVMTYQLQNRYEESASLLESIIDRKPHFSRVIYAEIAIAHFRYGNYKAATRYFNKFDSIVKLPVIDFGINGQRELKIEAEYRRNLSENIKACRIAKDSTFNKNLFNLVNLGAPVNTPGNEYFPFLMKKKELLYFTRQGNGINDENLFYSQKQDTFWSEPNIIDSTFNTKRNEGMATFTRDGRQMFFTACQRQNVMGTCDIQKANITNNQIASIKVLEGNLNSQRWESQACISCDGNILYFSSNREGGFGKSDLYSSYLREDNSWSKPKNLGPKINTIKDEESPFITEDGKTLFFSSTGHLGMGEQDIFMSQLQENNEWGEVINLGPPINTGYRELGFFLSSDGVTGFFSSDRPNGQGHMDIYQFKLSKELTSESITYVEGFVKDSITKSPIQTILYPKNLNPVSTNEEGRFFLCLKSNEKFEFKIEEIDYKSYTGIEIIPQNEDLFPIEIFLSPLEIPKIEDKRKSYVLPKNESFSEVIYFEFDNYSLTFSAQEKLSRLVEKLKNDNVLSLEIFGYCDSSGSPEYNVLLSRKRAQIIFEFLKEHDLTIGENHQPSFIVEGKGEINDSRPRFLNRKVEINWTKKKE